MKNRLLKTFTSLVLTVLMVISVMPAFAITIGAAEETYTWTRVTSVDTLKAGGEFIIGYEADANSGEIIPMANTGTASTTKAGYMYSGKSASYGGKDTLNMSEYKGAGDEYIVTIAESTAKSGNITIHTAGGYIGNKNTQNNCKLFEKDSADNGTSFTATIGANDVITLNNGNDKYHTFQYNTGSPRFACYGDTQKNLVIYKRTLSAETPACEHKNTTSVAEAPATCTTDGTAAGVKCLDCGEIVSGCEVIPAKGHKDDNTNGYCDVCNIAMCGGKHNWKETERKDATCTEDGYAKYECATCHETKTETLTATGHTEVIDKAVAATCTATGLTQGSHCSVCGTVLVEQTETPIIGHNYVDGKCNMCGKAEPVLPFKVGDVVIFTGSQTNSGKNYEFSGFDSKQTYGCAEEYSGDPAGMFPITIVEGNQSGTVAFKNGNNYIARNGSDIKLSTTLDNDSSWIVELDDDGNLVIKSYTGESNKLQFNASSPRFKTYTSNQQPIKVVKYPTIKSFSLSLNEGVTVKVTFDIPEAWLNSNTGAKVVFSNGESFDAKAGVDFYSVKLTPAQINDDLTVKIQLSDGSDYGATNNVSVSAYKAKVKAAYESGKLTYTDEKYNALLALIDAALTYSNAADGAINEALKYDFTGVADHTHSGELFTSFAGKLGTYASIYINVDTSKVPESGDTLVLTVGGTEIINGLQIANYITKDGQIVISGLFPANFDDIIYIAASTEGSNATFTFNSYLKAIYNDNSSTQRVKNLAVVTYLYGLAAEAYLATLK